MDSRELVAGQDVSAGSVDAAAFKRGMRHFAGACSIVATSYEGDWAGLTATAVMSVTAEPAKLAICVNRRVRAHSMITKSGFVSINVLGLEHVELAKHFGGLSLEGSAQNRFVDSAWRVGTTGAPLLKTSLVSFDCRVVEMMDEGSHDIFGCRVVHVDANYAEQPPLVYYNGRFGVFAALT
jgi:flavin reductase (NADH)/flavin reductase